LVLQLVVVGILDLPFAQGQVARAGGFHQRLVEGRQRRCQLLELVVTSHVAAALDLDRADPCGVIELHWPGRSCRL
jgi:hypothetical protein